LDFWIFSFSHLSSSPHHPILLIRCPYKFYTLNINNTLPLRIPKIFLK
jgi:hypothetical protein